MRRRSVLVISPGAALALAGCGTVSQQEAATLQSIIAGANAIELQLVPVVAALLPLIPIGSNDRANVQAATGALSAATSALAGAGSVAAGLTYIQEIEIALNTVVAVAADIPVIPPPYKQYLVAAALALPAIEALAGLAIKAGTALYATIQAKSLSRAPAAP